MAIQICISGYVLYFHYVRVQMFLTFHGYAFCYGEGELFSTPGSWALCPHEPGAVKDVILYVDGSVFAV